VEEIPLPRTGVILFIFKLLPVLSVCYVNQEGITVSVHYMPKNQQQTEMWNE
jgi:hypothetical protein